MFASEVTLGLCIDGIKLKNCGAKQVTWVQKTFACQMPIH